MYINSEFNENLLKVHFLLNFVKERMETYDIPETIYIKS